MAEYIDRQLLIAHLKKDPLFDLVERYGIITGVIESIPAADVVERKTGKWIYPSDITGYGRCSECKALWDYSLMINKFFKICPRCGSYNRGEDNV